MAGPSPTRFAGTRSPEGRGGKAAEMPQLPVTTVTLRRPWRDKVGNEPSVRYETVGERVPCEVYPVGLRRAASPWGTQSGRRAIALLPASAQPEPGDRMVMADGMTYAVEDVLSSDLGHRCELREVK